MSTFGGLTKEYPQVAIDKFQGPAVLRARAYFLSHCHADHMVGLDSKAFLERLQCSLHVKLYASEVTCAFLLAEPKYKSLERYVTSLPIEQPINIAIPDDISNKDEKLLVTLFPAGHCPGSVMFLFEGNNGNVLYTGDFRLAKGEAARMQLLHSGNRVKDIQSLYIDTTFCVPKAMYFPSREQSRDALMELIESQLQMSPRHMVRLSCRAKYGYEYLFVELSKEFNMKVHVSRRLMAQYEKVPELARHLTADGSTTQIHACRYMDCAMKDAVNVVVVKPSTIWFTHNALPSEILKPKEHFWRLCFSFHSSFSEIRDFVEHINPVNVYPNVIPYDNTEEDIINRLKDLTRGGEGTCTVGTSSPKYRPLGQLKRTNRLHRKRQRVSCDEDELAEMFGESPKKNQVTSLKVDDKSGAGDVHTNFDVGENANAYDDNGNEEDSTDDDDNDSCSSHSSGAGEFYSDEELELDLLISSQESAKSRQSHRDDSITKHVPSGNSTDIAKGVNLGEQYNPIKLPITDSDSGVSGLSRIQQKSQVASESKLHDDSDDSQEIPSSAGSGDVSSWLKYLPKSHKNKFDSTNKAKLVDEVVLEDTTGGAYEPDSDDIVPSSQKSEELIPALTEDSSDEEPDSRETTCQLELSSPTGDEPDSQETRCSQRSNASSGFSIPCTPEAKVPDQKAVAQIQEQLADGNKVTLASCKTQLN